MHSWEIGTLAEALTELEWCQLAVFASGSIPPPAKLKNGEAKDVLCIAEKCASLLFSLSHRGKRRKLPTDA